MFSNDQIEELRNYFQTIPESGDKLPNVKDVPDWTVFFLGSDKVEHIMYKNKWHKKVADLTSQVVLEQV